jgi:hypothetical protein
MGNITNMEQLQQQRKSPHSGKRAATPESRTASVEQDSLLHNSCKLYPTTKAVVESALQFDTDAIRRSVPLVCGDSNDKEGGKDKQSRKRISRERYAYPVNIALMCNGSLDVLQLLASEGPDVLAEKDGPDETCTLSIALTSDSDMGIIDMCIETNPACTKVGDRHANLPLHVAVRSRKISLDVINKIHQAYPGAVAHRNFHGETPLDVAVRNVFCSDTIVDHLQRLSFGDQEAGASHLEDADV